MKLIPFNLKLKSLDEEPLVSIVIDNYNYADYIGKAIDSAISQTYSRIEVIVVDDGSIDHSRDIINGYGDKIVKIFQKNSGQSSAFNAGIQKAQGQIVCLLDSDDYFFPDKVLSVVNKFKEDPQCVQVTHLCSVVNSRGETDNRNANRTLSQGDVRKLLLRQGKYGSLRTSALAYRREVLEQILPIPTEKGSFADAYLMAAAPFYGTVGCINEILVYYRVHDKNQHAASQNIQKHVRNRELIAEYINNTAAKTGWEERFDIQNDADYCLFKIMQSGKGSFKNFLRISALNLRDCLTIGLPLKETLVRLGWVSVCALSPAKGEMILSLGLKRYLKDFLPRDMYGYGLKK